MATRSDPLSPLLSQLLKQFGIGALVAVAFGYAVVRVYDDLGKRNEVLLDIVRESVRESRLLNESLQNLTHRIDRQTDRLDRLDRVTVKNP